MPALSHNGCLWCKELHGFWSECSDWGEVYHKWDITQIEEQIYQSQKMSPWKRTFRFALTLKTDLCPAWGEKYQFWDTSNNSVKDSHRLQNLHTLLSCVLAPKDQMWVASVSLKAAKFGKVSGAWNWAKVGWEAALGPAVGQLWVSIGTRIGPVNLDWLFHIVKLRLVFLVHFFFISFLCSDTKSLGQNGNTN